MRQAPKSGQACTKYSTVQALYALCSKVQPAQQPRQQSLWQTLHKGSSLRPKAQPRQHTRASRRGRSRERRGRERLPSSVKLCDLRCPLGGGLCAPCACGMAPAPSISKLGKELCLRCLHSKTPVSPATLPVPCCCCCRLCKVLVALASGVTMDNGTSAELSYSV